MVKTIAVKDGVWEKLAILKLKLKKKNMNDVVEELIKYYDNAGKEGKDAVLTAVGDSSASKDELITTTGGNVTAGSGNVVLTAVGDKSQVSRGSKHEWCRKKDSIKYFKAFLDWVDRNYKVIDWWEEEDSYCFETEKPPKS